jgi:anaerobic magnesium-protoporphyrin IX monomethyl ester cyclase
MVEGLHLDALLVYVEGEGRPWQFSRKPQLGLYYLAQHATDAGYQVQVDQLSANDFVGRRLDRLLNEHTCHVLGLYVDQDNLWDLRRILPPLSSRRPQLDIVLGGPQMTSDPERTLERIPCAICGCIGEGEETFAELLSLPSLTPESLKKCRGLAIRTKEGIMRTPDRLPIEPIDRLSFPRRKELALGGAALSPTILSGRGCTGRCAFCYEGCIAKAGKRLRIHSIDRFLEEFEYLVKEYDRQYICIVDDTFVADHRRAREICKQLIARYRGRVKWFCEARVDTLASHPDLLPLMVEAGLIRLQVGGESGSQRILDIYRKGITLEQIRSVAESAKVHGLLSLFVNFILGGAFETQETYEQTRGFALELLRLAPGCVEVSHSFYTPYPGTPMYQDPAAFGLQVVDPEVVTGMGDYHVFCRTETLSKFDILALGYDFDKCVDETMKQLCQELPPTLIERHFRAYSDWHISTRWYDFLASQRALFGYFASISRAETTGFAEASDQLFSGYYPVRTLDLVSSIEDRYIVPAPWGRIRQLDGLDSILIELSSGKLSLDDILSTISDHMPGVEPSAIRQAVLERYESLDKDFLLVWRRSVV